MTGQTDNQHTVHRLSDEGVVRLWFEFGVGVGVVVVVGCRRRRMVLPTAISRGSRSGSERPDRPDRAEHGLPSARRRSLFGVPMAAGRPTVRHRFAAQAASTFTASILLLSLMLPHRTAAAAEAESVLSGSASLLASTLPTESPCFAIDEIELAGPHSTRFRWLLDDIEPLLPRCLGVRGVDRILGHLGERLARQGYATSRVSLGQQTLASGLLTVRLHMGSIGKVDMVDAQTGQPDRLWGSWFNAFPTGPGSLLDVRDLEQGVEQMKRVPSQSVKTVLSPGEGADVSDVRIERLSGSWSQRLRGGLGTDNGGPANLGRTRWSANAALDEPLAMNDIVSISLDGNAEHPDSQHRSVSAAADYSVPAGYGLWSIGVAHSVSAQNIQLTTSRVLSSSASNIANLRYEHVMLRTSSTKTTAHAAVSTRRSRSFIDDLELVESHRRTTFVEAGATFAQLLSDRTSAQIGVSYRRGVPWLSAEDDLPPQAALTLRPRLWSVSAIATTTSPGSALVWSSAFKGQFTRDATTALDHTAIGGRGSVRGFDGDSVLMAENGWTFRNELNMPLHVTSAGPAAEAAFYIGIDTGRVWGPADALLAGHKLTGAVTGVRARWQSLRIDLALATPISKPEGFKTGTLNAYLTAALTF